MLFGSASDYVIRRVQVNQYGLKLNVTHQILIYVDVNILGCGVHTVKYNTEYLVVVSEEIGLKANGDKLSTCYIVIQSISSTVILLPPKHSFQL